MEMELTIYIINVFSCRKLSDGWGVLDRAWGLGVCACRGPGELLDLTTQFRILGKVMSMGGGVDFKLPSLQILFTRRSRMQLFLVCVSDEYPEVVDSFQIQHLLINQSIKQRQGWQKPGFKKNSRFNWNIGFLGAFFLSFLSSILQPK